MFVSVMSERRKSYDRLALDVGRGQSVAVLCQSVQDEYGKALAIEHCLCKKLPRTTRETVRSCVQQLRAGEDLVYLNRGSDMPYR